MAGLLLSGPAGGGKSQAAAAALIANVGPAVVIDFQTIYAGLLGIERLPSGRFPERLAADSYALPMAEYTRRAAITGAVEQEIDPIVTNSDGSPARRSALLGFMGAGAVETVIDPGLAVVTERLSVNGLLSVQCGEAINRWFGRL